MNSAIISACGAYRYNLTRGTDNLMAVVMLNPSTADANHDDPTIIKLRRFAAINGYGGIDVCNLYAFRATNPKELHGRPLDEVVGPRNMDHLDRLAREHSRIVVAWGRNVTDLLHEVNVLRLLRKYGAKLMCFGVTMQGFPRHPLYMPYSTTLKEFKPR